MLNTTSKSRRIIVERVDLRTDPRVKTEIVKISIECEIDLRISPAEAHKLDQILASYEFPTE